MFGQLLNGNPAVAKNPFVSVQKRDAAGTGGGIHVPRVKGGESRLGAQRGDVENPFAFGSRGNGECNGVVVNVECGESAHRRTSLRTQKLFLVTLIIFYRKYSWRWVFDRDKRLLPRQKHW